MEYGKVEMFTPKEAAKKLGVDKGYVVQLIHMGKLPAVDLSNSGSSKARWFIREDDLYAFKKTYRKFEGCGQYQRTKKETMLRTVEEIETIEVSDTVRLRQIKSRIAELREELLNLTIEMEEILNL